MPRQDQADQLGPPSGVLVAQRGGLGAQSLRGLGTAGRSVIGRRDGLSTVVASLAEKVVDGAERQLEALGQGRRGQPALAAAEDRLTDRQRDGTWHGRPLLKKTSKTTRLLGP
jgi:hypothetical protein